MISLAPLGFLLIILCLGLSVAWLSRFFRSPKLRQKQRRPQRPPSPWLSDSEPQRRVPVSQGIETLERQNRQEPQPQDRAPLPPVSEPRVLPNLQPSPQKAPVQLPSVKHLRNIREAEHILKGLRLQAAEVEDKLPIVIGSLRRINPYVFEELLLSCCLDQGWQIQRNFRYSGDGGIDGRVAMVKDRP